MGIDYYLLDHQNATFFELGKGAWYALKDDIWVVKEPELFLEFVEIEMGYNDLNVNEKEYYQCLGSLLFGLFSKIPLNRLEVINDCADDTSLPRIIQAKY
jgi:hypothetical protein